LESWLEHALELGELGAKSLAELSQGVAFHAWVYINTQSQESSEKRPLGVKKEKIASPLFKTRCSWGSSGVKGVALSTHPEIPKAFLNSATPS
jgi:hypothetical protein